jgi:hypothetical protein
MTAHTVLASVGQIQFTFTLTTDFLSPWLDAYAMR